MKYSPDMFDPSSSEDTDFESDEDLVEIKNLNQKSNITLIDMSTEDTESTYDVD